MQTAADKRTHVAQRRAALVASGICIRCAKEPAAPMKEHSTLGKTCVDCRRRDRESHYTVKARGVNDGYVSEDALSWLDGPEYKSFCADVLKVIKSMERPTIAEIKRGLGEKLNDRRLMDSFGTLVAMNEVREATFVSPLRYEAVR